MTNDKKVPTPGCAVQTCVESALHLASWENNVPRTMIRRCFDRDPRCLPLQESFCAAGELEHLFLSSLVFYFTALPFFCTLLRAI